MDLNDLISKNRNGTRVGLPSFCTANGYVLEAILDFAAKRQLPVLIEATCNQVNQEGGYTGMTPADFAAWLSQLVERSGLAEDRILLGGDHLGPNPWRQESAETALAKAEVLVRSYVEAGFTKTHLDASMACGGEPRPSFDEVARRAARLCRIAEESAPDPNALVYVIGTEVPVPGGETEEMTGLQVTTPERLDETIFTHRDAFRSEGIEDAWGRVVSVVTQPGVDFSHSSVHQFDPDGARELVTAIGRHNGLTFEGHSTDYQPTSSLAELVSRHVFFLKVGPELTFRFREAIFALAAIEERLYPSVRSGIVAALDDAMDRNPGDWQSYYEGPHAEVAVLRHFSLSDRVRYYWQETEVRSALDRLFTNLSNVTIPQGLITQFFGNLEFGELPESNASLCAGHIQRAVSRYYTACGWDV
ncbi:MAG: class II D-tagatose-bisphosphate aldolase, non-catalytic subunit [Rhodospirillales bacterium]|jgi:D-tagatose-1,6-bisphosphate aldolase subunit GatZ/KbaZ|nr:class II D-tagatose-bisphosphate aldolase, non-catalytic subunit [Rhodospirillales bacterium]